MAKKFRTDDISGFDEDWNGSSSNTPPTASDESVDLPYSGRAIQKFVREKLKLHETKKIGFIAPMTGKIDGYYHIRGFASRDDYNLYLGDPDLNQDLMLCDITIPISDEQGVMNIVELTTASNQNNLVSIDGNVILRMRFTSQIYNPVTQSKTDTYEDGVISIYRRGNANESWRKVGELPIKSVQADSEDYTDIDISSMLNSGACQLRVVVTGDQTQATTTYVVFQNVVKTSLTLQFRNEWQLPIIGESMSLLYTYTGDVAKTLNLKISGDGGERIVRFPLGTRVYTETPNQFDITDIESDTVKVMSHGVHSIEAWLSVDGMDAESEHVFSQVMVVSDSTDTKPYLLLNEVQKNLTNWTSATLFKWCVYNPSGQNIPVRFSLTDLTGTTTYLTLEEDNAASGVVYTFNNMIEIESSVTAFSAYMTFHSGNTELCDKITFEIDNSQNFAPVPGADFILNPKLRSNSEANPGTIINAVTGQVVPAQFKGFGFVSDGWVIDENGIRCLRVPNDREIIIDYETLSGFVGDDSVLKSSSLTIELDFAVRAISNESTAVLKMCSYTSSGNPLGFEMRPLDACFMTQNKVNRKDQEIGYDENVRTRVAVNLLYNMSNSGQNYCRIFENGIINKEFNYPSTDVFVQYVNGVETSQGIRIGGANGADIDIYSIKVYKKALTSEDVRQNYMASLDSSAEKIAFRDANDIMSGATISWDMAFSKYNVIKWIGRYATYGDSKKDKFPGTLVIHQQGKPEYSGTLTEQEEKGQGTSSMLYDFWNGDFRFIKGGNGTWTDELGIVHGQYFQLGPGMPKATKNVGKVNFASSQQSHKLGSCALYNDLYKAVCGGSSITQTEGYEHCRFAVCQEPFLFFIQDDENSEPRFAGFMTFGPGKGDSATFGFDTKKFPDHLAIEGADNDRDLVMGRVPWIEEDVTYDDEDWFYAGQKSFSLMGGDISKIHYFQDAYNFVFQTFDNIDYYEGTIEDLQADVNANNSKHYWLTQSSANNDKYDLYRYDFIGLRWVNAGINKLADGSYSKVNINTQCGNIASGTNWTQQNEAFKAARLAIFKTGITKYFNLTQTLFTMNFLKLIAASDNRGKNMYLYIDPITHLIGWYQDDLDTIFPTDNVGKMDKPYDVEEHDVKADGGTYWNSGSNSLFNQIELAFPDEQRANMNTILQEMAKLSDDGTVFGCFEKYYFHVQKYFPAVAYNEVARLVYERARTRYVNGQYNNGTDPITQSNGDSLQREIQWIKRRIAYISSYASYGEFSCRDAFRSAGSLNFRSVLKRDGSKCSYKFSIVPHISMYPTFAIGQSLKYGEGNARAPRIRAGERYDVTVGDSDGNSNVFINGIDYLKSIGDFTDKALDRTFTLQGERLTEFEVLGNTLPEFRPSSMEIVAPLLQKLIVRNVSTLEGGLDLSLEKKLKILDIRGTSFNSITLPATEYLTSVQLPATLRSLTLDQQPNLETVTLEGASALQRLSLGAGIPNSREIFNLCYTGNAPLNYLKMLNIDWEDATLYMVNYLASITDSEVTGKIQLPKNTAHRPNFANKISWLKHWGNVDSATNPLQISYYSTPIAAIKISGSQFIYQTGNHTFKCSPNTTNGNDVVGIRWELENNLYSTLVSQSYDECVVNVSQLGDEDTIAPTTKLHCYLTKTDGSEIHAEWEIGLYPRRAHIGDYVFYDGTYGPTVSGKTVVGICFYVNPLDPTDRRMVATQSQGTDHWGLYPANDGNGVSNSITLQDNETYNVYDIQSIANITSSGLKNNIANNSPWYVHPDNYLDEDTVDGFVDPVNNTGAADGLASSINGRTGKEDLTAELAVLSRSYKAGESVPVGLVKTLKIIQHRNKILEDSSVDLPIPQASETMTETGHLNYLIQEVVSAEGHKNAYRQFYYPAASLCYAYQPSVKEGEILNDKFKSHNWWLPSSGELARMYWHSKQGPSYPDDARIGPIFKHGVDDGVFNDFPASYHWDSTEYSSNRAWFVAFGSGNFFYGVGKDGRLVVRAVAAF